ncbi:cytochrome P450 [Desarmillaria tabescens]|uniref:Cytochrome P450 n=1 Tax=Armillaria tabescens TaxID=1929756 RepID=A0AA39JPY3_ARMTA|nr:cytochrome P450 [Desarmillaria tabescens]KAK0445344.1 cytochrome P450 [Desarmillaria tabescens]
MPQQDLLEVSDPKALQYIFHTSGYRFPKSRDAIRIADALFGQGLVTVGGNVHQRQRKILNGSFSASKLRQFLLIFKSSASLLTEKLNDQIKGGPGVLNAVEWTSKVALDIIGMTSFRYRFEALSGGQTELRDALENGSPTVALSYLSDEDKKKMSNDEIESQLATFILAGHDTTANAIAWLLYELARHPDDQQRIRGEIRQVQLSEGALTSNDYDSMPFLNAAIKETLRRHPFVHTLYRMADQDDILPLSEPVTTTDGRVATEILSRKANLPTVWGDDADRWNPGRFLGSAEKGQLSLGVYSNLMTFSAGVRACLGWRFAIMEIQTVTVELLGNFEFKLPDGVELLDAPGTLSCLPIVKGKLADGTQVPLQIAPLET